MTDEKGNTYQNAENDPNDSVAIIARESTLPSPSPNIVNIERPGKLKQSKLARQLGAATIAILLATILLNIFVVGFLSFLWYGNSNLTAWHKIMLRGWAPRAVTITALILRTAVDLQTGVATAMVAALSLEHGTVAVTDVARWSIARASKPRPRTLLFPSIRSNMHGPEKRRLATVIPILMLCGTTIMLQLASTVLLSDFTPGELLSFPSKSSLAYNYMYPLDHSDSSRGILPGGWDWPNLDSTHYPQIRRTTTWLRNPSTYPAFAEYSRPVKRQRHDVDDTGVLLRAFLPYSDASLRQTVSDFEGKTLVLDSHVACQKPQLTNLSASEQATSWSQSLNTDFASESFTAVQINGTVTPSVTDVDRLYLPNLSVPFSCFAGIGSNATSICQLNLMPNNNYTLFTGFNQGGGLLSEFSNITNVEWPRDKGYVSVGGLKVPKVISWGAAFLIIETLESGPLNVYAQLDHITKNITPPPVSHSNNANIWTEISESVWWHPWKVQASLCHAAWDTAPLDVEISGEENRTEPSQHWNAQHGFYTTPNITEQLLSTSILPDSNRQILTLKEKQSWIPLPQDETPINAMPFVQAYADMSGRSFTPNAALWPNWTAILTDAGIAQSLHIGIPAAVGTNQQVLLADESLVWSFRDLMKASNNSIAHSFSSLITILSGMAYYDQLPRFQVPTNVTQVFFTDVLFPQYHGGFWTITVAVIVHTALVIAIAVVFLAYSQFSFVGSYWHTVIQLVDSETRDLFECNNVSTDREMGQQFRSRMPADLGAQLTAGQGVVPARVTLRRRTSCDTRRMESRSRDSRVSVDKGALG